MLGALSAHTHRLDWPSHAHNPPTLFYPLEKIQGKLCFVSHLDHWGAACIVSATHSGPLASILCIYKALHGLTPAQLPSVPSSDHTDPLP